MQIEEEKGETPAALAREPVVFPDLYDIKEAFITLSPSRPTGFGVGFIPLTEIHTYTLMFPVDDIERLIRLIRAMDSAFVEAVERKNRKESEHHGNKTDRYRR